MSNQPNDLNESGDFGPSILLADQCFKGFELEKQNPPACHPADRSVTTLHCSTGHVQNSFSKTKLFVKAHTCISFGSLSLSKTIDMIERFRK